MSLSLIGSTSVAASSVTIPTHQVGDLIVIWAQNKDIFTRPTKPTASGTVPAFVDISAATGTGCRTAYFVATATNTTSGTWTNATGMIVTVIRGADATTPIGSFLQAGGTSASGSTAPAVTPTVADGSSFILEFYAHRNNTLWSSAPAGYTRRATTNTQGCFNTKDVTTTAPSIFQGASVSGSGSYRGETIEIIAGSGTPPPTVNSNFLAFM